uniref:Bm4576 n=2 Tax=Brugia TaxID=6278 RepID=A0A1I9G5Y6_BRUMA|nr:Bm4576 [Brugia malayi]
MAFSIFSWTAWITWVVSFIFISAIDWDSAIVATPEEINLAHLGPLWTYFGKKSENISIFHSREYMQKRKILLTFVIAFRISNHNYSSMTAWLKEYAMKYPNITWLYSIGESVRNKTLWVLAISRTPRTHRLGVPEIKYVANMHGNEVVGREAMLYLIALLCDNYGKNWYLTNLVNNLRIHIMPSINPDGYELGNEGDRSGFTGRSNDHGIDLNRNFPARFPTHRDKSGGIFLEKETIAAIKWFRQYPFVLSANFHGGSLVANYPYDDSTTGQDNIYSPTVDDRLFVALAYSYARAHSNMWKTGRRCGLNINGDFFLNGITNGAFWYHVAGGMQDWQYVNTNCLEITIEMGCYKFPQKNMLPQLWDEHKYSLLAYFILGIRGFVLDQRGHPVKNAVLSINQGKNITTTDEGEFWRILLALNSKTISCVNHMLDKAVSSMIDALNVVKTFQLGISLGCDFSDPQLTLTAVKYFLVGVFCSSHPVEVIKEQIFRKIKISNNWFQKTSSVVYDFAADLCLELLQYRIVREVLNTSTLILIPSIPYTQLYCHDYVSVMQFKPFIEQVLDIYPLIDYAILLGTGGMKVRYSDVSRMGRTRDLALNYISQHTVIKPTGNEMCSRNNFMPVSTVSELQWDMEHWQKAPDILLVEVACCFEEGGNLYAENKASLLSTISKVPFSTSLFFI